MQGKTAKKNHIRILPFFLIIALAAGSLSACGKNDSGTGSVSSVSNEDSTAAVSISESVSVSEETETPEMPATLEELHESIEEFAFAPEMEALPAEEKVAKTADFLREMEASGLIEEGSVTEYPDMELVSFRQEDGCLMFVDFRKPEDGTLGAPAAYEPESIRKTPSGENSAHVVVYSALEHSVNGSLADCKSLQDYFDVTPEFTGEVTLATAKAMRYDLKGLEMIILELHGALYPVGGKVQTCVQVYNDTALTAGPERTEDFMNDRMFCYMGMTSDEEQVLVTMITPAFFTYYYGDGGLSGAIVHLGSCHGFGDMTDDEPFGNNYVLSDALLSCGAEAVVGHNNSVYTVYDLAIVREELEALKKARTLGDSLENAKLLLGENDKIYVKEHTDYQWFEEFDSHTPSGTSIRGNKDAVLFVEIPIEPAAPEPDSGDDSFTPLHPEAPETPGGTVIPDEPADESWRAAYARILHRYSSSAKFVLSYGDSDLVPELFIAEAGAHVDGVDIYTYKQGDAGFLGNYGSFGTVRFVPYENTIVSNVEYFGEAYTEVYRIDGFSFNTVRTFYTNENNSAEGVETVYQVDGQNVSQGAFNLALDAVFSSGSFYNIGYGQGFENSAVNQAALNSGEKSFNLPLG